MKFDLGGKAVTGWRDLLMRLYAEDVFGMRVVSDKIRPRMIAHVRSLLQDTNRVATVPDAALGAIVKQYTEVATVDERLSFLEKLATDLGTSKSDAVTAFERFMQQDSPDAMRQLRIEVTPAYNRLLHRLVNVKGGLHLVVEMRADLLSSPNKSVALRELETELAGLLRDWFSTGLLQLTRLTFNSSASILQKVMHYSERVSAQPITKWSEMQRRLGPGYRMYAFFHPIYADEPLVYVEVALFHDRASVPDGIGAVWSHGGQPSTEPAQLAVFYSIASTQDGLRGLTLGEFLIKRVMEDLARDGTMNLTRFVTMSPVPGFVTYLQRRVREAPEHIQLCEQLKKVLEADIDEDIVNKLCDDLLEKSKWDLMRLCASYLLRAKRKGIRAMDPVANFHLRNGALLQGLHWRGDMAPKRLMESFGICVNYEYISEQLERNHNMYTLQGIIPTSEEVANLLPDERKGHEGLRILSADDQQYVNLS